MKQRINTTDITLNKSARITIRLSPHLDHELTAISQETGCDRSLVLRTALLRMVNDYRDAKQG